MSKRIARAWALAASLLAGTGAAACGDDAARGRAENPVGGADASDEDGGADEDEGAGGFPGFSACERKRDGTACGPSHHCIGELCLPSRCGDGVKTDDEECDDGNEALGDDCSPACRRTPATCGDGEVNHADEECDDGNRINDDACANSCTRNVCGNARVDVAEECDDGNGVDDDLCSNGCTLNRCRNGRLDPGEECDDGNRIDDDGCTNACIAVVCGDGVVYEGIEECDDGNTLDGDACSSTCKAIVCGNNRIDGQEACDGTALPPGVTGVCNSTCTQVQTVNPLCDVCRREDDACTTGYIEGINLLDDCLTSPPQGESAEWVELCSTLSRCIAQSRCDEGTAEVIGQCICGPGVSIADCQANVVQPNGACRDAFIRGARCTSDSNPLACAINTSGDPTNPAGNALYLAQCEREKCAEVCR